MWTGPRQIHDGLQQRSTGRGLSCREPVDGDYIYAVPTVSPFLWFNEGAAEAMALYERVFHDSANVSVTPNPASDPADFMSGRIRIGQTDITLFNGGPYADFTFSPAISLFVSCEDQAEVDRYWHGLSDDGEPGQCGWLKDRFGVSWQIVPKLFDELMSSSDAEKRDRVLQAMMQMTKFDCAALQAAYGGEQN